MTLYRFTLLPLRGGRRAIGVCSEPPLISSASVLGGVVRSDDASPKVVDERLVWREFSELELELFFDLLCCESLRMVDKIDGMVANVGAQCDGHVW
jgi:hypothetical protein